MRVYISGAITNNPEYVEQFDAAEKAVVAEGHEVVNPAKINMPLPESTTHEEFMHVSFALMDLCDTIYMLKSWTNSKGAHMELEYALRHRMPIFFEGGRVNGTRDTK